MTRPFLGCRSYLAWLRGSIADTSHNSQPCKSQKLYFGIDHISRVEAAQVFLVKAPSDQICMQADNLVTKPGPPAKSILLRSPFSMNGMRFLLPWALLLLNPLVLAAPTSPRTAAIAPLVTPAVAPPLITPAPVRPTRTRKDRRGIISDLESIGSDVAGDIESVLSDLGSVPSYVASGVADFFQNFPIGEMVEDILGLDDSDIDPLPTQVLNLP